MILIVFHRDMRVVKNTSRGASVEQSEAQSAAQPLLKKAALPLF